MAIATNKIITYSDLISSIAAYIANNVANNASQADWNNIPACFKRGYNVNKKRFVTNMHLTSNPGTSVNKDYYCTRNDDGSSDVNNPCNYYITTKEQAAGLITTHLTEFLQNRSVYSRSNAKITAKGLFKLSNNLAAYFARMLCICSSSESSNKYICLKLSANNTLWSYAASNYPAVNTTDDGSDCTLADAQTILENLDSIINNNMREYIITYNYHVVG